MRSLLLLLAAALPLLGSTFTCTGSASSDTAGIQAQLNAGGSQTTAGSCVANNLTLGTNGLNWQGASGMTITASTNGSITLNITATGAFTMNALKFEGFLWNANNALTNATITNNTLENTTAGSFPNGGGWVSNGFHNSTITGNTFNNLFSGGYTAYTVPGSAPNTDTHQPACWVDYQGLDGTVIRKNIVTKCGNDGIHFNPNGSIHSTNSSEISHNNCTLVMRACYEIQIFASNLVVKDNYAFNYNMPSYNSFAYSIASVGKNFTFINNFGSLNHAYCQSGVANFLELFIAPSTIQGNVAYSLPLDTVNCVPGASSAISWNFYTDNLGDNGTGPSSTNTVQNNVMCGNAVQPTLDHENGSQKWNIVDQYNYKNTTSCPGSFGTSSVAVPVFTSSAGQTFPTGGSGTWTLTQISTLPITDITWTVDGAFQSIQEISDVNTNFASDLKWGYHATFNTSAYSNGSHNITATATDVLGATNTASQTFTVGSTTGPAVQFSPTSVAFGSQTVSTASSPSAITLTNIGSATLTISSITVTGTNAADFGQTNTCGSSLAAAASCTISVVFTPGALGSRTASISVADNAPATPQTVGLSGTGMTATPCKGILLNCDFSGGTASWSANTSPFATWAVDTSGPTGVNASHVSVTSVIPSGNNVEVFQDNLSPTNGATYRVKMLFKTNRTQQWNIRLVDSTTFTDYGLTWQPVVDSTKGWYSQTFTFTVINSPPAGSARFTVQTDSASPGDENKFTVASFAPLVSTEVTAVIFPYVDHATASVGFQTLTNSNQIRIRYGAFPYDCTTGTGGTLQNTIDIGVAASYGAISIGGMAPATAYSACPEPSKDGGVTFLSGFGGVFTTQPLPAVHPSLPIKPIKFDTSYPDTTSYATPYNVLSDCSDFGTAYTTVLANWALSTPKGTVINVPPGTTCTTTTGMPFSFEGVPPDVFQFLPSAVNTSTSEITWTGHPFAEGDLVMFSRSYATLVTYPASTTCDVGYSTLNGGGIASGPHYQVHPTGPNTFQVYCLPDTQYDPAIPPPTPAIMQFTTQGSVTSPQHFYAVPFKQFLNTHDGLMEWKRVLPNGTPTPVPIVRSGAPDSQLPPEGTQITSAWASKMATFLDPATNATTTYPSAAKGFIFFGDLDSNIEVPALWRLGPGIKITMADYSGSVHSSDPAGYSNVLVSYPWDSGLVYDRIWYHGLGAPNRLNVDMPWNGSFMAAIDSLWDNMTYFHANNVGLAPARASNTQFTIATGTPYTGFTPIPITSPVTCNISGSGSGTIFVYQNLLSSNAFTVAVPSGITATCTGISAVSASAGSPNGTCNASDAWPKTGNGEVTVAQIACITVSSGVIGTATAATPYVSIFNPEGDNHMIGGFGPGPYIFQNNFSSGAGIPWHYDASGGAAPRSGYTWYRNYLFTDPKYQTGSATSDGLRYYDRQHLEWKGGDEVDEQGNIFDTTWRDDTPDGTFEALTPLDGASIRDVNIQYNTFRHGSAVMEGINTTCPSDVPSSAPCARPAVRYRFQNNLVYDIDGYTYTSHNPGGSNGPGEGWNFQLYGVGDMIVDHNTYASNRGNFPLLFSFDGPAVEGYQQTGNIEWITGVSGQTPFTVASEIPLPPPGCTGLGNIALLNCGLTQGPGTTLYNFSQNLIAGGYTDSSVPSGQITTGAMSSLLSGLNNSYLATGTVAGTTAAIGWSNPSIDNAASYCLVPGSSYKAGTNAFNKGADLGVNCNELAQAQGLLQLKGTPAASITTSGFSVSYIAADSAVVWVGYSTTNDITTAAWVADSGGARARSTAITGLATKTHFYYWVLGPGNAIMSQRSGDTWTN